MKNKIEQQESVFKNINLSDTREDTESKDEYKIRRKRNRHMMKLYLKFGPEVFRQAFPEGVTNESFQSVMAGNIE